MQNRILLSSTSLIQLKQFYENTKKLPEVSLQSLGEMVQQEWVIEFGQTNVAKRYNLSIHHRIRIGDNPNVIMVCEALSCFSIDLEREIVSRNDFPINDLYLNAVEAAAHNRVFTCQLTANTRFTGGFLVQMAPKNELDPIFDGSLGRLLASRN